VALQEVDEGALVLPTLAERAGGTGLDRGRGRVGHKHLQALPQRGGGGAGCGCGRLGCLLGDGPLQHRSVFLFVCFWLRLNRDRKTKNNHFPAAQTNQQPSRKLMRRGGGGGRESVCADCEGKKSVMQPRQTERVSQCKGPIAQYDDGSVAQSVRQHTVTLPAILINPPDTGRPVGLV